MINPPLFLEKLTANLVPFFARKVDSEIIWCASNVIDSEELQENCSYLIDPGSNSPSRIFHAERYGGSGLQRNGGGARCGLFGQYQIKGIGANPLVGDGTDWSHGSGALGVSEAIYETVWSEILDELLPYGAVKVQAVLLTNSYLSISSKNSKQSSRRALLVREPVVRPAHFERAPYFRPQMAFAGQLMHDARRVRAVISQLPACLPTPQAGFSPEAYADSRIYCIEGLSELAQRLAWQMAFCRTRFLKVTTSPSNISIDGKLLDFNGLGCLFPSNYCYDFSYQLRLKEMMKEPAILRRGLSNLCLYLGKYLFDPTFTQIACQQINQSFEQAFQSACYHGYLSLLGITIDSVSRASVPDVFINLVESFLQLLENRRYELFHSLQDGRNLSALERLVKQLYRETTDEKFQNDSYFRQLQLCLKAARPLLNQNM